MTTTFSVTYEIPVSPERMAQLEDEISRAVDSEDAEFRLVRLANQMLPEKRTEPARQVSHDGLTDWFCPRLECPNSSIASVIGDSVESDTACGTCGAIVNREDHPMPLDLYRMRTRRTDGVEIQPKPRA